MKQVFLALVRQDEGSAYGVEFPDVPGCFSAADDLNEVVANAQEALALWFEDEERVEPRPLSKVAQDPSVMAAIMEGASLLAIPLIELTGRTVKANLTMDAGLLQAIDETAKVRGMTRSAFISDAARRAVAS
jgi:predicted RNase H-like HicB family nuclease